MPRQVTFEVRRQEAIRFVAIGQVRLKDDNIADSTHSAIPWQAPRLHRENDVVRHRRGSCAAVIGAATRGSA